MAVVPPYVRGTWLNVHYPFRGRFKFTFKVQVPGFPFRGSQAVLLPYTRNGAHDGCKRRIRGHSDGVSTHRRSLSTRELPEK